MATRYVMKATHINSAPLGTVYWVVTDTPDLVGTYSGYNPADLTSISIDYSSPSTAASSSNNWSSTAGGDLSGTFPNPTVAKIQSKNVSSTSPADGYVLTWNTVNNQWQPKRPDEGGWITALDLNFTSQSPQTLSSNTNYTIGNISWTKSNSSNEASSATIDSNGLTFQPGSTSDYNGSTRTLPLIFALFKDIIPNFDLNMDVRITIYNSSLNNTANYDNAVVGIDTNNTTFGVVLKRGHGTTGQGFQSFYNRSAANVSGFISSGSAPASSNNTMIIEVNKIGNPAGYKTYDGYFNTDYPTPVNFNPHKGYFIGTGTQSNDDLTTSNLGIFLGAQRAGSGTSLVVRYARIKVEYRGGNATGAPAGTASGDLSGTFPSPTVAKIQGKSVNSIAPNDGYILTWSNADSYWLGKPKTTYGPFNSKPTTNVIAGETYYASDSGVLSWVYDGSLWRPNLFGQQLGYQPPAAASFTYLVGGTNNDGSTAQTNSPILSDSAGQVLVTLGGAQGKLHPCLITGHATDVQASIVPQHNRPSGQGFPQCQLVLRENATGKMAVCVLVTAENSTSAQTTTGNAVSYLAGSAWTNVGSRSTVADFSAPLGHGPLFIRVRSDGSTGAIFSYSYCPNDSNGWIDFSTLSSVFTSAPNSGSNPFQCGISIQCETTAITNTTMWLRSYKQS